MDEIEETSKRAGVEVCVGEKSPLAYQIEKKKNTRKMEKFDYVKEQYVCIMVGVELMEFVRVVW